MENHYCTKQDKVRENMYYCTTVYGQSSAVTTISFTEHFWSLARILFHVKGINYKPYSFRNKLHLKTNFYHKIINSCRRIASKFIIRFIWVMFYLIVILVHICCVYTVLCKYIIQYTFTSHLL